MTKNFDADADDSFDESEDEQVQALDEQAEHEKQVRKRIYDLLEQKRLKALLDDSEDWSV